MMFEKMETEILDHEMIEYLGTTVKAIARNVFLFNVTVKLSRPWTNVWAHYDMYYKSKYSQTYQQYLINVWEHWCDYFAGRKAKVPMTEMFFKGVKAVGLHANFKFECPFPNATLTFSHERANLSNFIMPLLAAGRYRVDVTFAGRKSGQLYKKYQIYFEISDFRVWN